MTNHEPTAIDQALARIEAARGVESDAEWAREAHAAFVLAGVRDERAAEALLTVADQVAASGEAPSDLFGTAAEWASDTQESWREAGVEHMDPERTSPRSFVIESLVIACGLGLLFVIRNLIGWDVHDPVSLAEVLAPLALGGAVRGLDLVYKSVRSRYSNVRAVLASIGALVAMTAVIVGLFATATSVDVAENSVLTMLGASFGYGILAWIVGRAWPEKPRRDSTRAPLSDAEWLGALGSALRERGDMSDARVTTIVDEARTHASESGATLSEEFGSPRGYAERFTENRVRRSQRKAWYMTALTALIAIVVIASIFDETLSAWTVVWLGLVGLITILEWRGVAKAKAAAAQ